MVKPFVLEEHDGVGIADGGHEERARVARSRRHHHLEPGNVGVELLLRFRVVLQRPHATAERHAHHHLAVEASLRAHAVARRMILDLMKALEGEAGELDLAHGFESVERHSDGGADDGRLRERAVDHALAPERAVQVLRHPEHPAVHTHVLADDHHIGVALHLLAKGQVQRLDHGHLGHRLLVCCPRMGGEVGGAPSGRAALSGAVAAPSRLASSSRCRARWAGSSA